MGTAVVTAFIIEHSFAYYLIMPYMSLNSKGEKYAKYISFLSHVIKPSFTPRPEISPFESELVENSRSFGCRPTGPFQGQIISFQAFSDKRHPIVRAMRKDRIGVVNFEGPTATEYMLLL